jgi:hypothetical protein
MSSLPGLAAVWDRHPEADRVISMLILPIPCHRQNDLTYVRGTVRI